MNILKDPMLIKYEIEELLKEYNTLNSDKNEEIFTAAKQNDEKHLECFYSSINSSDYHKFLISYQVYYLLLALKTELLKEILKIEKNTNDTYHSFIAFKLIALFVRMIPLVEFPILSEGKFETIIPVKFDNDQDLIFSYDKYQLSLTHNYLRFITDKMVLDLLKDLKEMIFVKLQTYTKETMYIDINNFIVKHIQPLTIIIYEEDKINVHNFIVNMYITRMNNNFNSYSICGEMKESLLNFKILTDPVLLYIIECCFKKATPEKKSLFGESDSTKVKYNLITYYLINNKAFEMPPTAADLAIIEERNKPKSSDSDDSGEKKDPPKTSFEKFLESNDITSNEFTEFNQIAQDIKTKLNNLPEIYYYYILEDDEYYKDKLKNDILV